MSRYISQHPTKPLSLSYGYDRPLQQYFFAIHSNADDYTDEPTLESDLGGASRSEMLTQLEEFGIDTSDEHYSRIVLDLPI